MKKILILSHKFSPDIGGIESITEILATEFARKGFSVRVATWSVSNQDDLFEFQVIRNPGLKELIGLHRWADIVFENNPCIRLSWPSIILNRPTVVALQTWIEQPDGTVTWMDKLKRLNLKTAKSVIAVSEAVKKGIFKKAVIIHNPFKAELFTSLSGVERNKDFVFLGRLVSDKGADLAIEALAKLHKENTRYHLTIIGDGPEREPLVKQANDLGLSKYMNFTGSLTGSELVEEICRHRYMLIPSKWKEPFGIVALEAIACGCIPIVSDGGGLPDAVGEAGLVFQRGNLNDLVEKIKLLLADPAVESKIRGAARAQVAAHHPEIIAEKYLEEFRKIL